MSRRLRSTLLAVSMVAAGSLAGAGAPAHAASGMEMAVQDDGAFVSEINLKRKPALKLADKLFTTRIRVNLPWATIVKKGGKKKPPKHRRYDFASYDALTVAARKHGIKLQLTLSGFVPRWATGNRKEISGYKPKMKYWKEFVKVVVKHFRGIADRYAIWNEPNYISWLAPLKDGPRIYRKMYIEAYKLIRSIDPGAQILIGETAPYAQSKRSTAPLKFIRAMAKGGGLRADGFAHHPYDFRHPISYNYPGKDNVTISGLPRLTSQLSKLAKSGQLTDESGNALGVYLTEYGYMGSGKYKIPESRRAKYLTKAFQIALDDPHVKQMLQYLLVRPPKRSVFFDTSIVTKKGKRTTTFKALQSWAKKRADANRIALPPAPPVSR